MYLFHGLFGTNQPVFGVTPAAGTSLFGATTTQAPAFGTNTSTFGFGSNTQNQTGGLFGAKPATGAFGATPASTGFGAFGAGGLFGAKPQQTTAPTFGSTAPAFGTSTGFGTNTTGSGLFGANTFGKPATTQPFGFTQPTLGLGGGLGTSFQSKPAAPAFGTLGGGSLFSQPNAAPSNTFRTGLDSGLGGGSLFGNTSTLGGTTLGGLGQINTNNSLMGGSLSGASAAGNVHEHMLALAARPYGDTGLFKDLLPDASSTAEDVLKPTNPRAVKAVLDGAAYRVTSPPPAASRLKVFPRPVACARDKKSLFDGLEESDPSIEDKLTLKPSRKRLVLRPKRTTDDDEIDHADTNRSLDDSRPIDTTQDQSHREMQEQHVQASKEDATTREKERITDTDNNNSESFDRHSSWLGPKQGWSDKEKPIDNEPTPRLYPNLDKELPIEMSERRTSWLTTKPLCKPPPGALSAENSVRHMGLRPDRSAEDKENIDTSVSEGELPPTREAPPHPAGVKLTRPGYYTIPTLDEMTNYIRPDGSCVVPHLTIGRKNYGNVYYDCELDVAGLDLDALVHFMNKEILIYPEDEDKPPVGQGLNRRAIVTLERVWPRDKTEKRPITEPDRLLKMDYEGKLRRVCDKHDTKFVEYRPQTGSWVFRVEHFSKYGLTDSDEEDDVTPDILKRQLVTQTLQKAAAPAQKPPVVTSTPGPSAGLGGLGGLGELGGLGGLGGLTNLGNITGANISASDEFFAMQQTSLNLMEGTSKAFDVEVIEDNTEAQSLYDDNRAYGVKSPTSELARLENRQSHHVQLMKASLYADVDAEMEDDTSVSTGEQLVPHPKTSGIRSSVAQSAPSVLQERSFEEVSPTLIAQSEDVIMRPLVVQPYTVVLNYHRKVPPFRHTIAGRVDAAYVADMSVSRARHSRVGFGPAGALAYVSSYDTINDLPKSAELNELGKYVAGRGADDWSEPTVARLAVGLAQSDVVYDTLSRQLASLLEFSTVSDTDPTRPDVCPRLVVRESPRDRRELLRRLLDDASKAREFTASFGVSSEYSLQVWKLCEALWGADLDNDGVPGTDIQSKVHRHECLLQWLKECVASVTDKELAEPTRGEPEDELDGHSARVWTLLLGGRVLEACKLSRDCGDLNMAALIAQATGDPAFKSLIARQITNWQECGAETLVSASRRASLHLIAGLRPAGHLETLDWLRALRATARYLCPQIPTLEQVVRTYEGYFGAGEELELATLPEDEMGMQLPLPPYDDVYTITTGNGTRRSLDLRYELIRARAFNSRPRLSPATYSPDPFDYSLNFLLGVWLGAGSAASVAGAAEQLEALGGWHLAVQVLAYHPDDAARSHLIRGVISRHAPSVADTPDVRSRLDLLRRLGVPERWVLLAQAHRAKYEVRTPSCLQVIRGVISRHAPSVADTPDVRSRLDLLRRLGVPERWVLLAQAHRAKYKVRTPSCLQVIRGVISRHAPSVADTPDVRSRLDLLRRLGVPERWVLLAQAHRAKYERKPSLEVQYLVGAEEWTSAHRVLVDELLPEAVLADNLQSIKGVLEKMSAAAARHEVGGWETGGQALYHYLRVCDEIRGLVNAVEASPPSGSGGVTARLEALRPALTAACRALKGLSPKSARHAAARAEMGARLVQLALAAGEPPPHLAALLKQLRLPPDTAAQAVLKITTDLAEKASELCIDSTPSSPLSSHHRTAIKS
ncbi:nuclear pore complex protein Nup98-Nup96 isoform X1 [Bicyclus anynana]|uniref:Nuclear pore complex protein Nup98-Nup96 n=1 Tax=Bicyclus anynana TaxID=110368 RepID=A0ABM3M3I0_BICAN|nr:nuclear pore complex protein Nup98-Nup96 isoform X1 [Bicyclus anynana]